MVLLSFSFIFSRLRPRWAHYTKHKTYIIPQVNTNAAKYPCLLMEFIHSRVGHTTQRNSLISKAKIVQILGRFILQDTKTRIGSSHHQPSRSTRPILNCRRTKSGKPLTTSVSEKKKKISFWST